MKPGMPGGELVVVTVAAGEVASANRLKFTRFDSVPSGNANIGCQRAGL
jgi:hypothetical protein